VYGEDPVLRLGHILMLGNFQQPRGNSDENPNDKSNASAEQLHGSLLAQAMLQIPGCLAELIQSSLVAVPQATLMMIAKDAKASHVLQDALTLPTSTIQFRRRITAKFSGKMSELALDSSGSHVADVLWLATKELMFVKQRFAEELLKDEKTLRESFFGRAVWRNWSMDLYKRRRGDWLSRAKGLEGPQGGSNAASCLSKQQPSRIDLARARFAARTDNYKPSKGRRSNITASLTGKESVSSP
jgi:nucleolar protein 9